MTRKRCGQNGRFNEIGGGLREKAVFGLLEYFCRRTKRINGISEQNLARVAVHDPHQVAARCTGGFPQVPTGYRFRAPTGTICVL